MEAHRISDAIDAARFMTGARAYFTLRSTKTGTRYTFKVKQPKDKSDVRFISVLDSDNSYAYMGMVKNGKFGTTSKSKVAETDPRFQAFKWTRDFLATGKFPSTLEFWHEGKCACCGRRLTVPASIETGIGPECIKKFQ